MRKTAFSGGIEPAQWGAPRRDRVARAIVDGRLPRSSPAGLKQTAGSGYGNAQHDIMRLPVDGERSTSRRDSAGQGKREREKTDELSC